MKKSLLLLILAVPFFLTQPVLAKSKIDQARDLVKIDKTYQARALLNEAIVEDPLNAALHYEAGIIFFNLGSRSRGDFDLAMKNACKLEKKYCYEAGEVYYTLGFNAVDGRGRLRNATEYFRKAFNFNKSKRQEAISRLYASGNEYLAKGEVRRAKKYYEVVLSLDPIFRDNIAKNFFEAGKKASPMEALYLFENAISYSKTHKKEAGHILAEKIKKGGVSKNEEQIKDKIEKYLSKAEFKKLFPPDFREFKVGRKHEYRISNMKKGESNGFYIRGPRGFPTKQFVTSFGTGVKAVYRDGREFDLSTGRALPDGDKDFMLIAYEDGARALVWFEKP